MLVDFLGHAPAGRAIRGYGPAGWPPASATTPIPRAGGFWCISVWVYRCMGDKKLG
jgi:hypothetical protein